MSRRLGRTSRPCMAATRALIVVAKRRAGRTRCGRRNDAVSVALTAKTIFVVSKTRAPFTSVRTNGVDSLYLVLRLRPFTNFEATPFSPWRHPARGSC